MEDNKLLNFMDILTRGLTTRTILRSRDVKEVSIMHIRNALICILPLLILFLGCFSGSKVTKGERFEALFDFKVEANIQGIRGYSDGFKCHIPKGTILEALVPINSPDFFECQPVMVNGNSDKDYIITTLVSESALGKKGFESFSFTLPLDYIGMKIKRID